MLANVFFFYLPGSISSALPVLKESGWVFVFHALTPSLVPLLVGLLLMRFPSTISNRMLRGEALSEDPNPFLKQIERIAFSVLGLFVLSRSLSDLTYYSATYFWGEYLNSPFRTQSVSHSLSPDHFGNLVSALAETVFGAWLLLGADSLGKALTHLRARR